MKVVYLGGIPFTDLEFPLIRELQNHNIDLYVYYYVGGKSCKGGLIDIDRVEKVDKIISASEYESFQSFSGYINLDKVYVINNYHWQKWHIQSWLIWIKFIKHAVSHHPNVFHFVWPLNYQRKLLFLWNISKVLTVHDPIPHSSQLSNSNERNRIQSFRHVNKLILLNDIQIKSFIEKYNIPPNKIACSSLGSYDCINFLGSKTVCKFSKYILFFGQIQAHKGIDVLLEAMKEVHEHIPSLGCVIAGKGNFHFDICQYSNFDHIEIRNRYINIQELSGLLKGCLFAVCPYKDATQSGVVQTAFSAGVPLIVTDVGSLPSSVPNEEMGLVIPPNNVEALAKAIIRLSSDNDLLDKFRSNIENKWRKTMSWKKIAEQYVQVYNSLNC